MTQENKELLLTDLCARLPYGVKCQYTCVVQEGTLVTGKSNWIGKLKGITPLSNGHIGFMVDCDKVDALEGDIKPYLRPMSSMTDEEKKELFEIGCEGNIEYPYGMYFRCQDWLNAHHFDFRNLIERGLAIEVTEDNNPYKE